MTPIEKQALAKVVSFIAGICTAGAAIAVISFAQHQDEQDAQFLATQVMACSSVMETCQKARERQ